MHEARHISISIARSPAEVYAFASGVLDHDVELESGAAVHNPMRVVPNGEGSELSFTLIRQPGMSDAQLAEDAATVASDLRRLKDLLERSGAMDRPDEPPDAWLRRFEQHLAAGDLEAVVDLYETDAKLVGPDGEVASGRAAIRALLADLIHTRTRLHGRVGRVVRVGDLALLYTDWEGSSDETATGRIERTSRAIELLRRQPDRTWRLIVGDPRARNA